MGYFSLDEFESLMMPDNVTPRIERDVNFAPTSFNSLNLQIALSDHSSSAHT